jgi:hypothetical protein
MPQRLARNLAIAFFAFWLVILLAGADKPPPRAFLWMVLVIALCAVVVYRRIPTYLEWQHTRRPGRLWRVALDGLIAGLLAAALPLALRGGEPSATPQATDYAIWFTVLAILGMLNSGAIFAICAFIAGRAPRTGAT